MSVRKSNDSNGGSPYEGRLFADLANQPMHKIDRHQFIFICGLHRSGTSPLFQILREHPEISGFRNTGAPEDEGQHLQTVFPPAKAHGGPGRFGFAAEAHLTEESDLITADNKHRLLEEWSRYWDLSRPYLLEKSPPNLVRTRFLQSIFPDSYFIIIYRHPIAVSLATSKWVDSSLDNLVEHWLRCHRVFELDRPHLVRALTIKYEDLISATEPTLEQVYQFLGVEPQLSHSLNPSGNERYFSDWRARLLKEAGQAEFRQIVSRYELEVLPYGYSLLDCGTHISWSLPSKKTE